MPITPTPTPTDPVGDSSGMLERRDTLAASGAFATTGTFARTSGLDTLAESGFLYISGDPSLPPCKPPETQAY